MVIEIDLTALLLVGTVIVSIIVGLVYFIKKKPKPPSIFPVTTSNGHHKGGKF